MASEMLKLETTRMDQETKDKLAEAMEWWCDEHDDWELSCTEGDWTMWDEDGTHVADGPTPWAALIAAKEECEA